MDATDRQRDAKGGEGRGGGGGEEGEGEVTDIKSNNPHLTGGEKSLTFGRFLLYKVFPLAYPQLAVGLCSF